MVSLIGSSVLFLCLSGMYEKVTEYDTLGNHTLFNCFSGWNFFFHLPTYTNVYEYTPFILRTMQENMVVENTYLDSVPCVLGCAYACVLVCMYVCVCLYI